MLTLLILSPSSQHKDRLADLLEYGIRHLEFACSQAGRARWTRSLRTSLGGDVVERTVLENVIGDRWNDQCQSGMTSVDDRGNVGLARRATGFMTNDEYVAEAVDTLFRWARSNSVVERQSKGDAAKRQG